MIAFASSLDQAGPMARSAEDCALLLSAMSGFDATRLDQRSSGRRGLPRAMLRARRDAAAAGGPAHRPAEGVLRRRRWRADVRARGRRRAGRATRSSAPRSSRSALPRTELSIPVYYIIAPAEASSNLSRFDGVRYGHRAKHYGDLLDMYKKTRAEGFGAEVKRRIMIGTYVLSHGYYDAYYLQAQKMRRMIADDFQAGVRAVRRDRRARSRRRVAWKLGEQGDDPVADYLADIFTLPGSAWPACPA